MRLETVWQDARRGSRALVRSPGFTLAAVLTLWSMGSYMRAAWPELRREPNP